MKSISLTILGAVLLATLAAAGCHAAPAGQSGGQQQDPPGGGQLGLSGTQGIITKISENSITIAVMPEGSGSQGGNGQMPRGTDGQRQPRPSGSGNRTGSQPDTSNWEKKTYTIDDKTKIVRSQMPRSTGSEAKTLTASDLKVGGRVGVTTRSGQDSVADQIAVMQSMGGFPGSSDGQPGNARDSAAANDTQA